jgi:hypothetical protein
MVKIDFDASLAAALEEYRNWGKDEVSSLGSAHDETLYHYTDGRGLLGIIGNRSMHFTDFRHLNDPSELTYGRELLEKIVISLPRDANWHHRCFMTLLFPHLVAIMKSSGIDLFVASFSTEKDDLSQWRAYADDGRGFAIGFDPKSLGAIGGTSEARKHVSYYGPITYGEQAIQGHNRTAIERACGIIDRLAAEAPERANYNNLFFDDEYKSEWLFEPGGFLTAFTVRPQEERTPWAHFLQDLAQVAAMAPFLWNCLTVKHPAYEHEREFRLAFVVDDKKGLPDVQVRLRGRSELVPYIERPFPSEPEQAIREIRIGPAAGPDTEHALRQKLRSLQLDGKIMITRSTIPYRS